MSSQRRIDSSRANGAKSRGPITPAGKLHSSQNALRHGLLADCILLQCESAENFDSLLQQHVDCFQPADGVEFGMMEEMTAAKWRLHRTWAMQTRMFEKQIGLQPAGNPLDRMTNALETVAVSPSRAVLDRYESRFHLQYQRALRNLALVRTLNRPIQDSPNQLLPHPDQPNPILPNEPSPISEQPAPAPPSSPQVSGYTPLSTAASAGYSLSSAGRPRRSNAPAKPPSDSPAAQAKPVEAETRTNESGAAA